MEWTSFFCHRERRNRTFLISGQAMGLAKIVKDGDYENQHLVREVPTLKNSLKLLDDGGSLVRGNLEAIYQVKRQPLASFSVVVDAKN